jgi:hypothetical protein
MLTSLLRGAGCEPRLAPRSTIAQLLIAAAMVGGAGSLLLPAPAQATPVVGKQICWFGTDPLDGSSQCTTYNPISGTGTQFALEDKTVSLGSLNFGPKSGTLGFQFTPIPPAGYDKDLFALALDFNPDSAGPYSGSFDYTLDIDSTNNYEFATAQLDSIVNGDYPLNTTVEKKIVGVGSLFSINGSNVVPFNLSGKQLIVENIWNADTGDVLDSFKDVYTQKTIEVPGPLPLLGAGIAFGFSRKLRGRIKASTQA